MYPFFTIIGVLLFLFIFHKRLKEDYGSTVIFSSGFFVVIGTLSAFAASQFVPFIPKDYWYWMSLAGASLGYLFSLFRFKLKVFESLEALGIGLLLWQGAIFFAHALVSSSFFSLGAVTLIIGHIIMFIYFEGVYKNISWYRSGRVGFSGLLTLASFFLIRGAIALSFDNVLSFVGKVDAILSSVLSLSFFATLYLLSRK